MPLRSFQHVSRGGSYYRICGPDWEDPADTSYSQRYGGRWNPAGSFGALYLNENLEGARANARRFLAKQFGPDVLPEDIAPEYLPDAAEFTIATTAFVDAVTAAGRKALKLAASYAENEGHAECQAIGSAAYEAGEDGAATLSVVTQQSEELVVFDRALERLVRPGMRQRFENWWTPIASTVTPQPKTARKQRHKRKATK